MQCLMNKKGGSICKTLKKHCPKEEHWHSWMGDLTAGKATIPVPHKMRSFKFTENEELNKWYSTLFVASWFSDECRMYTNIRWHLKPGSRCHTSEKKALPSMKYPLHTDSGMLLPTIASFIHTNEAWTLYHPHTCTGKLHKNMDNCLCGWAGKDVNKRM